MNDQRFDRDLTEVLRAIAGEEAPVSLRYRLANVTEQAPISSRLSFAPPMRLSLVVATAAAVLVLAMLLLPGDEVGPLPSDSASPTPSVEPSEAPEPTAEPTSSATPQPTPPQTPIPPSWTSLAWSDAVVPFPYLPPASAGEQGTQVTINDIVEWNGAYVGVGTFDIGGACAEAGFFRSADGLHWDVIFRAPSGDDRTPTMCPSFVVPVGDELIAVAQERIWRSADGSSWSELDPASLRSLWTERGEELVDLAAGPGGMVIIGKPTNTNDSIVAFSRDGQIWAPIELPAGGSAIARDATAYAGGFVIVGRDGEPDGSGSPSQPYTPPGVGSPAAWISPDGETWSLARVDGSSVKGGTLTQVLAGADGLFAIGNDAELQNQYEEIDSIGGAAWRSADGQAWEKVGTLESLVPQAAMLVSYGTNIVALADGTAIWISTGGLQWSPVSVTGDLGVPSYLFYPLVVREASPLRMYDVRVWATGGGLIVSYTVDSPEGFAIKQLQLGRAIP